jgi:hypothetical protein
MAATATHRNYRVRPRPAGRSACRAPYRPHGDRAARECARRRAREPPAPRPRIRPPHGSRTWTPTSLPRSTWIAPGARAPRLSCGFGRSASIRAGSPRPGRRPAPPANVPTAPNRYPYGVCYQCPSPMSTLIRRCKYSAVRERSKECEYHGRDRSTGPSLSECRLTETEPSRIFGEAFSPLSDLPATPSSSSHLR